jgi:hypothetical protein
MVHIGTPQALDSFAGKKKTPVEFHPNSSKGSGYRKRKEPRRYAPIGGPAPGSMLCTGFAF